MSTMAFGVSELDLDEMISVDGGELITLTTAALLIGGGFVVGMAIAYFA